MGAPAVILEVRDVLLPTSIGPDQAQSIEPARQNLPAERPLTHNLPWRWSGTSAVPSIEGRIDDLVDNTFCAKIDADLIQEGDCQQLVVDARPSDGIGLGLRVDCPIAVTDDILDMAGHPADAFELNDLDDNDRDRDPDAPVC